jgi:hypothetical protein
LSRFRVERLAPGATFVWLVSLFLSTALSIYLGYLVFVNPFFKRFF